MTLVPGISLERKISVALILLYLLLAFFNYSIIDEDAFIYYRCIENILSGNGYTFNPGIRIEAGSSITWVFLLCVLGIMGMNLLTASLLLFSSFSDAASAQDVELKVKTRSKDRSSGCSFKRFI